MKKLLSLVLTLTLLLAGLSLTAYGSEESEDLETVYCEEQDFTTKMPEGASASWQEGNGLRIWLDEPGYVPNVLIYRRTGEDRLNDPENYVTNVYREYMEDEYGKNLVGTSFSDHYDAGGKRLIGGSYIYRGANSGAIINLLHLVEVRKDGDVEYFARYLNDERDLTLDALDIAVRYYQAGSSDGPGKKPDGTDPIVTEIGEFSNDIFTVGLPKGWKIMIQGEYTTFNFKAWDPENPDRAFFLFMKLEPYLKSWEAKEKYKEVAAKYGGSYTLFAQAPVLEYLTVPCFLNTMPQLYDFCDAFCSSGLTANPAVLPQITDVEVLETAENPLPCPPDCYDSSIALFTCSDFDGNPCEGIATAQPTDSIYYDFFGLDGWYYTVYQFIGITAPEGELDALLLPLSECLSRFAFEEDYVKDAIGLSREDTEALLAQGEAMQAAHDAMVEAWNNWE